MGSGQSFVQAPQGGFAVGCAALFLGLPALGGAASLAQFGLLVAAIPLVVAAALLLVAYVVFNEEVRVTLDERGLRLSRARVLFGARLREQVDWEIPLAALTRAREVHTRTPARGGGWNHSTKLQLPEGRTLDARELGGDEDAASAYQQLRRVLEQRLGDAFEREERV